MQVDWLALVDFRSYRSLEWSPENAVNVLVGPNGAGKTNVLESIGYLASLKSFRGAPEAALIHEDAEAAVIRAGVSSGNRERLIEIEMPRTGPRRTQVDKTRLRRAAELLGALRVVAFMPEDLDLIKRGPALRRDLLDDMAVQLWPAAYLDQSEYERSLRQRNAFLKSGDRDPVTLSVWDSRLAQAGGRVIARRMRVIESVGHLLDEAYQTVAGEETVIGLRYRASWIGGEVPLLSAGDYADSIDAALESSRRTDYERRMTTVGPHRDDPTFTIGGREARTHASQGEQRTLALAVKLAAHRAISEAVADSPVLLLDDVFSELDPERAKYLASALPAGTQTLITTARPEDVPVAGRVWAVSGGVVR